MNKNIKFLTIILLILIFGILFYIQNKEEPKVDKKNLVIVKPTISQEKKEINKITKSLFVPYWTLNLNTNFSNYDRVIYFGLSGKESGINKSDQGYMNLEKFIQLIPENKQKYLTLRMTNTDENIKILKNNISTIRIIEQIIEISKKYNFDGVVLDLEMGVLFGDNLVSQINDFSNLFYEKLIKENIKYSIAIYGDVFYRKRPYDISNLSKNSDEIMIMAYDFHKSIGEPGPNFPLNKAEIYNYDFKKMINDFLRYTSEDKISVIFGIYGYDWIVDEKGRPVKAATALSFNEVSNKYLKNCLKPKCKLIVDTISKENKIELIDDNLKKHIIWFENERSVNEKIKYLKSIDVSNVAYWANGYF